MKHELIIPTCPLPIKIKFLNKNQKLSSTIGKSEFWNPRGFIKTLRFYSNPWYRAFWEWVRIPKDSGGGNYEE